MKWVERKLKYFKPRLKKPHTQTEIKCQREPPRFPFHPKSSSYDMAQLNPFKKSSELSTSSSRPDSISLRPRGTVSGTRGDAGRPPPAPRAAPEPPCLRLGCSLGREGAPRSLPRTRKGPTRTQNTRVTSPSGAG